jgi:predicted RNA-binding Zn ribbon-like protein
MSLKERPAAKAKLLGGRLCLDFVNTVGGRNRQPSRPRVEPAGVAIRDERLNDYDDLLAWSLHAGLLTETQAKRLLAEAGRRVKETSAVFQRAHVLREAIYRLCLAVIEHRKPSPADLTLLNQELGEARRHQALTPGAENFVWQWVEAEDALDRMLWPVTDSAGELLSTADLTRLHQCGGDDCGWLFEDNSRNRKRQWCDMQDCGNLAKVRRFRARRQEA